MKTESRILRQEMCNLIERSCTPELQFEPEFQSFHKSLLKFYFNALDAFVDYESNRISLVVSEENNDTPAAHAFQSRNTQLIYVHFDDLSDLLIQCLEEGEKQDQFYKNLLFYHNHVTDPVGAWSA
ncbi:MAG: hypothetical protein HKO54_00270 [Flavobacteriaceae bacterium]|nr:hypothetical protein [Flavobacteriaceae bacterium]